MDPIQGLELRYPNLKMNSLSRYTDYNFELIEKDTNRGLRYKIRVFTEGKVWYHDNGKKWEMIHENDVPLDHLIWIRTYLRTYYKRTDL